MYCILTDDLFGREKVSVEVNDMIYPPEFIEYNKYIYQLMGYNPVFRA